MRSSVITRLLGLAAMLVIPSGLLLGVATAHPGHEKMMRMKPRPCLKLNPSKQGGELLTACSTLKDGDITVRIISVLQISRKGYIRKIAKLTRGYDVVLEESLGHSADGSTHPFLETLRGSYQMQAKQWKLRPTLPLRLGKTPVMAVDLSLKDYAALSKVQQKSVLVDGFADHKSPELVARELTGSKPASQAFTGHTAFDAKRTDLLIQTFHRQLIAGKKKICIVVGAARSPAVELRLRRQNFHLESTTWLAAWQW